MADFANKDISLSVKNTKIKLEKNVAEFLKKTVEIRMDNITENLEVCESPIEQFMCMALNAFKEASLWRELKKSFDVCEIEAQVDINDEKLEEEYRVDFLITLADQEKGEWQFAVECDSKEYHFTEKAFHLDRKRDKELLSIGIITIRFTGSEIVKSPLTCITTLHQIICQYVNR
jgi:very-short-patch-repair endonuclease